MNSYDEFMMEMDSQLEPLEQEQPPNETEMKNKAQTLLTTRECNIESFIRDICPINDESLLDESDQQSLLSEAENKLADASLMLSHKYGTVLKSYVSRQQQQEFVKACSKLPKQVFSKNNMCYIYSLCFEKWINSEHINFSTLNKTGLGRLTGKECFIAHLFSMATCRRVKGDDCFALSIVGRSSVGKTRIIEHCLQQASFTYASEPGVGRFNVQNRPILLYRDINIELLVKGGDSSKFRTICRSEMTSVKVHSATVTLPPLWVAISANQRINSHTFPKRQIAKVIKQEPEVQSKTQKLNNQDIQQKSNVTSQLEKQEPNVEPKLEVYTNAFNWSTAAPSTSKSKCTFNTCQTNYPSQLMDPSKKSDRQEESFKAVQNRVLELFVRERPDMSDTPLPSGVIFQRSHLIVGIYNTILQLMSKHSPEDFNSPILISYLLTGLCDNLELYKANWCDPETREAEIISLILHYVQDVDQQNAYLARLKPSPL